MRHRRTYMKLQPPITSSERQHRRVVRLAAVFLMLTIINVKLAITSSVTWPWFAAIACGLAAAVLLRVEARSHL